MYLAEGYARKAVETLRRAKNENADDVRVMLALGNAYIADEPYGAAVKKFREVLDEAPELEIAHVQLAKALRADGRVDEAEQVYLDSGAPHLSNQY